MKRRINKKGFTIVELLAVVVIIGVIGTIAIVGVNSVIKRSHEKYNLAQAKLFVAAAQTYFSDHKSRLPIRTFTQTTVTLNELIEENYIDQIVDYKKEPYDVYKSYASATKMGAGQYAYDGELITKDGERAKYKENKNSNGSIIFKNEGSTLTSELYTNNEKEIEIVMSDSDTIAGYIVSIYKNDKKVEDLEYKEIGNSTSASTKVKLSKKIYKDGKYKIRVKLIDIYNNQKIAYSNYITIDTIAPKCSLFVSSGTKGQNNWYTTNVMLGLKVTEANKYLYDNGNGFGEYHDEQSIKNIKLITRNTSDSGTTTKVFIKDVAGNTGNCELNIKKDSSEPTCNLTVTGEKGKNDWYINKAPEITVTGEDSENGSGIDSTQYKLNNKIGQKQSQTTSTAGTLWTGTVQDKAGNSSTCTTNVKYIAERPVIAFGLINPTGNEVYYSSTGCIQYAVVSVAGIAGFTNLMPLYNSIDSTTNFPNYLAGGTMLASGELRPDNYKCDWPFCYYYLYTHCANGASEHHFEVEDGAGQKAHASTKLTITTSDSSKNNLTPKKPTKKTVKISYGGNVGSGNTVAFYCSNNSTTDEDSTLFWEIDRSKVEYKPNVTMKKYDYNNQDISNRGPIHRTLPIGFYYNIRATCKYGDAEDSLTINNLYCYANSSVTNQLTQTTNNCLVKENCRDCSSYCAGQFFSKTLNDDDRKKNSCDCSFYHDPTKCPR